VSASRRLDDLPLYADDRAIAEAVVGKDRAEWWLTSVLPRLPGFPPVRPNHKGRYTPAVRAYYDRQELDGLPSRVPAREEENPESWKTGRRLRG
jgi:hypothetical protein